MNKLFSIISVLIISIIFLFNSNSKEIKILYKINEEIITSFDIDEEANYLKTLNKNLENIPKDQLYKTATQSLIREKIKKREIERIFNINYEKSFKSSSMQDIIESLYRNLGFNDENGFSVYLKQNSININDLKKKFIIEQMWNQLIVNKFSSTIKIDEKSINEKVDQIIKNKKDITNYELSEIVFYESSKLENEKKFNVIKNSISKIGFEETAILYSISESSKLGGKIGWINENQLSDKIKNALNKLKIGEYSEIINTAGGNIILKLNEKKIETPQINRDEEIKKIIRFEKNKLFNQHSIIFYKELETKAYVEKL